MKLMVDQRRTNVVPKVQAWYAFWYAWFSSHGYCWTAADVLESRFVSWV